MALKVRWCDDLVRLDPFDAAAIDGDGQEGLLPPVRLRAARNGAVSFQLSVGPLGKTAAVSLKPGTLRGPGGSKIGAMAFDVFAEWYHRIGERWYPDALVPQEVSGGATARLRKQMGLKNSRFAAFWVDLFVPADSRPGSYSGKLKIKVGRQDIDVPVEITVSAARIPVEPTLDMSFNNYTDGVSEGWPELVKDLDHLSSAKYLRAERGVFAAAHDHRGFLHYLPYGHSGYIAEGFAPPLTGEGPRKRVASWTDFDRHFGPYFDGSAFKHTRRGAVPLKRYYLPLNLNWPADFTKFGKPGYEAEWRAVGGQMVEHFRKKGWTKTHFDLFLNHKQRYRYFPWDCEEARFLPDNDIQRKFRKLWQGTFDRKSSRGVKFDYTLGTTWTYGIDIRSDFTDFVDVYIAGTDSCGPGWYPEDTPKLHKKGAKIWSCTHSGSIRNSTRAPMWSPLLMWMRDVDGFMPRWASLAWGGDTWHAPRDAGGTTFFYPGAELGTEETYPALRLKALRNSMQTIDLLERASRRKGTSKNKVKSKVNRLLGVKPPDWHAKRPKSADTKLPKDWTGATFATTEPPSAGWQKFDTGKIRELRDLAIDLAGR